MRIEALIRSNLPVILALAVVSGRPAFAQGRLDGRWALDREASQFPQEVAFAPAWATAGGDPSSPNPFAGQPESEEEATRTRLLLDEVRTPPVWLSIAETPGAVTIADERGRSRTFHPNGMAEALALTGEASVVTSARWDDTRLVVVYAVADWRQIRYTYAVGGDPRRLTVEVQLVEKDGGQSIRRVYDTTTGAAPASAPARPAQTSGGAPTQVPGAPPGTVPAEPAPAGQAKADLRPGAELRGLRRLGIVVEDLGSQAIACGLKQDALTDAAVKPLTDAGLQVVRNTDEDTYLYVNVMAATVGTTCVSRYDVTLYTHTTAMLPYTAAPVLVQVELLHKSAMAGGAPAANGDSVVRGVAQFVDQITAQIRDANK